MEALEALLSRRSIPAEALAAPGPDAAQVDAAIDAALRAPDHGRVQPWRFRLVRGEARAAFAALLERCALAREPGLAEAQLEKLRRRPLRAPLVVVVSARLKAHPKVPESEQLLAAGAGAMNLLNAFHAQGFGAIWLTGASAYDPAVAAGLGLPPEERLLGFVYVGSIAATVPPAAPRMKREAAASDWQG
jgi:nitroreductase